MEDSAIIRMIIKKLNEHHKALDKYIERSYKDSRSLNLLVKEVLGEVSSIKELLEGNLEQIIEIYNALHEWNDLRERLQNLETSFSLCYEEVVRLRRQRKNPWDLDVSAVEKAWDVCKRRPLSQLIEFAKDIEYIGEPLRVEVNGSLRGGEKWIVDLVDGQQRIDESIREYHSGDLHDSINNFNVLINITSNFVDEQMRRAIERVSELL